MPSYTLPLNERDTRRIDIGPREAAEMMALGFRFSIFSPTAREYQISRPYTVIEDRTHGTLTIEQEDAERGAKA